MKIFNKIFLGLLLSLGTVQLFAQTQTNTAADFNYSFAINGFSLTQLPKIQDRLNYQDYNEAYLNGLAIKFNNNQISYRLKATYFKKDLTFANNCTSCEISDGRVKDFGLKVGFEKVINYARVQPYFGFDVGFKANSYKGKIYPAASSISSETLDNSKNGITLSPILGLKVNIIPEISLFAEGTFDFYYSYEKQQRTGGIKTVNTYKKWEYLAVPITAGLTFNIDKRN
jgi:hypothetical protein